MFFLHFVSDGWMGLALEVDWFLFFFFHTPLKEFVIRSARRVPYSENEYSNSHML